MPSAAPKTANSAAAVPIGTVNRFDWTYRSTRPIGGGASTTRITAPPGSFTPPIPTKSMAVRATSGAATTPSRRVESDVNVRNGPSVPPARIAAARSCGFPVAITSAPR